MSDTEAPAEKAASRSRNYPAFGLPTAIERARALYDRDGKAAVNVVAAVKAWGYTSLNGRSMRALGALRQFGLLDDTAPKTVKLSSRALQLLVAPKDSPDYRKAIQEATKEPTIYRELLAKYEEGLPSDESLIHDLVLNSSFSEEAATAIVSGLRASLSLDRVDPEGDTGGRGEANMPLLAGDKDRSGATKPKKEGAMSDVGTDIPALDFPIPLVSGGQAILRVPRYMSEADHALLTSYLDATLKALRTALLRSSQQAGQGASDGVG